MRTPPPNPPRKPTRRQEEKFVQPGEDIVFHATPPEPAPTPALGLNSDTPGDAVQRLGQI
jgi:hypothetical protein